MKIYTEDQWYVTDGKRCNLADTLSHRRRQKLYGSNPVFISARCRKAALHKYRQEEKILTELKNKDIERGIIRE